MMMRSMMFKSDRGGIETDYRAFIALRVRFHPRTRLHKNPRIRAV